MATFLLFFSVHLPSLSYACLTWHIRRYYLLPHLVFWLCIYALGGVHSVSNFIASVFLSLSQSMVFCGLQTIESDRLMIESPKVGLSIANRSSTWPFRQGANRGKAAVCSNSMSYRGKKVWTTGGSLRWYKVPIVFLTLGGGRWEGASRVSISLSLSFTSLSDTLSIFLSFFFFVDF